jgi:hypothetical protein
MRTFVVRLSLRLSLLTVLVSLFAAAPASAQSDPGAAPASEPAATLSTAGSLAPQLKGPSIWALVHWNGIGVGGRFMIPLPIPALLSRTPFRDSWALEGGVDFIHRSDDYGAIGYNYNEFVPTVGMMWIVWLKPNFAVYPKVEAGWAFGFSSSDGNCGACELGGIYAEGAAGLLYAVGGGITLRAEVGSYGIKGGAAWLF